VPAAPIKVGPTTTAKQLTIRTTLAARAWAFPAAALMVGHQLGEAMVPVLMGIAIDRAVATSDPGQLLLWVVLLGVDFAFLSFCYRFGSRLGLFGVETVQHQLRMTVAGRLLNPGGLRSRAVLPGEALSIATSDVGRLSTAVAIGIHPIGEFAAVLFSGVVLLTIAWPIGVFVLVGAPLLTLLMDWAGGPLRRRSEREQELAGDAAGTATDLVTGLRVLNGIGATGTASDRYRQVSRNALRATLHASSSQGLYLGTMQLGTGIFTVVVAMMAGYLALTGQLTVGELIAVVGVTQFVMYPLEDFASNFGTVFAVASGSARRVLGILQGPTGLSPAGADRPAQRDCTLELVAIENAEVHGLSLTIQPGECVGIVADPDACRALVEILGRRTMPESGQVLIDGASLFDLSYTAATGTVLVAPHDADLFEGTIAENVDPAGHSANKEAALKAAACQDVIESVPGGLTGIVGESGRTLSGGQRQRVALARAFAAAAPVLVLHDPTTAVDSVTEASIAGRLRDVRGSGGSILLTTSPALLAVTDRVIVLDGGAPAYCGRHADLMSGNRMADYQARLG
jgi:ABC-type multidrug transport system fused ATPase/permease subunit